MPRWLARLRSDAARRAASLSRLQKHRILLFRFKHPEQALDICLIHLAALEEVIDATEIAGVKIARSIAEIESGLGRTVEAVQKLPIFRVSEHRISAETSFGGEGTDSKWAKQFLAELADGLKADAVEGYLTGEDRPSTAVEPKPRTTGVALDEIVADHLDDLVDLGVIEHTRDTMSGESERYQLNENTPISEYLYKLEGVTLQKLLELDDK